VLSRDSDDMGDVGVDDEVVDVQWPSPVADDANDDEECVLLNSGLVCTTTGLFNTTALRFAARGDDTGDDNGDELAMIALRALDRVVADDMTLCCVVVLCGQEEEEASQTIKSRK
jgi:hypothetical protein